MSEATGREVTRFRVGDPVFGFTGTRMGCHAEYRCLPEEGNGRKGEGVAAWNVEDVRFLATLAEAGHFRL